MSDTLGLGSWSAALAKISELAPIEETARTFKAFTRARGIRSTSDLLRLALIYASAICRPGAGRTNWRLHVSYDLSDGVDDFELTDDKGAERLTRFTWTTGGIAIANRGYARPGDFAPVLHKGGHLVVRTGWSSLRLLSPDGELFDLFDTLEKFKGGCASHSARIDTHNPAQPTVRLRLIVGRPPPGKAEAARKKVLVRAVKVGKKAGPRSLEAAGYVMTLTSLPEEHTAEAVLQLYRLRWQIELFLKRFKSLIGLGELPAKQRDLARAWICGKLILALLAEKTARKIAESSPSAPSQNASRSPRLAARALARPHLHQCHP